MYSAHEIRSYMYLETQKVTKLGEEYCCQGDRKTHLFHLDDSEKRFTPFPEVN